MMRLFLRDRNNCEVMPLSARVNAKLSRYFIYIKDRQYSHSFAQGPQLRSYALKIRAVVRIFRPAFLQTVPDKVEAVFHGVQRGPVNIFGMVKECSRLNKGCTNLAFQKYCSLSVGFPSRKYKDTFLKSYTECSMCLSITKTSQMKRRTSLLHPLREEFPHRVIGNCSFILFVEEANMFKHILQE